VSFFSKLTSAPQTFWASILTAVLGLLTLFGVDTSALGDQTVLLTNLGLGAMGVVSIGGVVLHLFKKDEPKA
jgi:hypothetical protein